MKKEYNSPKVVITTFDSADITSVNLLSAVQTPDKSGKFDATLHQ